MLNSIERLHLLLKPYIKKSEIKTFLECTENKAKELFDDILTAMRKSGYKIIDYKMIPTKLFMQYCNISLDEMIRNADLEIRYLNSRNANESDKRSFNKQG